MFSLSSWHISVLHYTSMAYPQFCTNLYLPLFHAHISASYSVLYSSQFRCISSFSQICIPCFPPRSQTDTIKTLKHHTSRNFILHSWFTNFNCNPYVCSNVSSMTHYATVSCFGGGCFCFRCIWLLATLYIANRISHLISVFYLME